MLLIGFCFILFVFWYWLCRVCLVVLFDLCLLVFATEVSVCTFVVVGVLG